MSAVGQTLLKGHALIREGHVLFNDRGVLTVGWPARGVALHAKCQCGALSPAGIGVNAAKRWHRQHKEERRG